MEIIGDKSAFTVDISSFINNRVIYVHMHPVIHIVECNSQSCNASSYVSMICQVSVAQFEALGAYPKANKKISVIPSFL
jgi:hypothetical protein